MEKKATKIVDLLVEDVRFPTSLELDGSDASHPDPDYSAVYVTLVTDSEEFKGRRISKATSFFSFNKVKMCQNRCQKRFLSV